MCDCQKESRASSGRTMPLSRDAASVNDQLRSEIDKLGRQIYQRRLGSAARKALALLPEPEAVEKLDATSRMFVDRISSLVADGLKAAEMDDMRIAAYAQELAWGRMTASIAASAMAMKDNGGGGGEGKTCVTKCADEYDKCVKENDCDTGGWICLCCSPCSLQYMGCVARCVTVGGGFGGIVIA